MKKMNEGKYRITRFAPDNRKKNIYIHIYMISNVLMRVTLYLPSLIFFMIPDNLRSYLH